MKTRRLSEKKIHIVRDMDIFCSGAPEILIETFSSRLVYRKTEITAEDGNAVEIYRPVIRPGFIARIGNKYRIKSKFIITPKRKVDPRTPAGPRPPQGLCAKFGPRFGKTKSTVLD
jgi:hypothetical protein